MRTLVHLRHAERAPGGVDLTPRGRSAAAGVGRQLARFDRVLTSPKPRAVQTAEAMGYLVDGTLPDLEELPEPAASSFDREPPRSFAEVALRAAREAGVRTNAEALAGRWAEELERLPDGGRLLLVSHGGIIELGAVGAVGPAASAWGPPLERLEGIELARDRGRWVAGSVVRPRG